MAAIKDFDPQTTRGVMPGPAVTFMVIADSHKRGDQGKIDAFGLFDIFNVWAVPAQRECSLVFGVKNLQRGVLPLVVLVRRPKTKAVQVVSAQVEIRGDPDTAIFAQRLPLKFEVAGAYEIGIRIGGASGKVFWIPVRVNILPWPELPVGDELERLLKTPNTISSVRAVYTCNQCKSQYVFQINLDPNAPLDDGALPFPEEGSFRCHNCRVELHTRDVEGQLRAHLGPRAPRPK